MDIARIVDKLTAPLQRRVASMITRVILDGVNDALKTQGVRIEGLGAEPDEDLEHMQPGGLSHVPEIGAEGLALRVGARGDNTVVIALGNRSRRPKGLAAGETAIWSGGAGAGTKILCKANGDVEITPTAKVTIDGDLEVSGEVTANTGTPGASITLTGHLHPSATGPTGAPTPGT